MSDLNPPPPGLPAVLPAGFLVLGKYNILETIRIYPWCVVYAAEDVIVRRPVQLTLLDPHTASAAAQTRFKAAIEKLKVVRHPGLARVFALLSGDTPRLLGAAADLTEASKTLADAIEQRPVAWPFDDIKPWLLPALEALSALHQADLVLGNISPWTLLQTSGAGSRVLLCDLPRLRLAPPKLPLDEASAEQQVNPLEARTLAPEWLADPTRVSPSCDVYAMGVLLHRLLSGRYPFHAEHQASLLLSHLREDPPRAVLQSATTEPLVAITLKALAADPAQRFGSAAELLRALQNPNDLGASWRTDPAPAPAPVVWRAALQRFDTLLAGKITGSARALTPPHPYREIPATSEVSAIQDLPHDTVQDLPAMPAKAAPLQTLESFPAPPPLAPSLPPPQAPPAQAPITPPSHASILGLLVFLFFVTAVGVGIALLTTPRLGADTKLSMNQQEGEAAKIMATMPSRSVDMVLIPAGAAMLGVAPGVVPWRAQLTPQQPVVLDSFFIMRHEVSVAAYARCVQAKRCAPTPEPASSGNPAPGSEDTSLEARRLALPVVNVTWHQAKQYCEFIQMRLPTEAEWEKAARGLSSRLYPWGEHPDCRAAQVQGDLCLGSQGPVAADASTADISPYGVMHMGGNVWEWTADWYAVPQPLTAQPLPTLSDPAGPTQGPGRVIKGGDWASAARPAAERLWNLPDEFSPRGGFRCAVTWAPNSQSPINRSVWGQPQAVNLRLPRLLLGERPVYELRHPSLQTTHNYKK